MSNRSIQGNKQYKSDDSTCSEEKGEIRRGLAQGLTEENDRSTTSPAVQSRGKAVSFNVRLLCTSHGSTVDSTGTISLTKLPESVGELKKAIQKEFDIPVYDQKLSFGCSLMEDGESLDFYRLKDGDQITVEYTGKAQVESVFLLIAALREALDFLKTIENELKSPAISFDFSRKISDALRVKDIGRCTQQLVSGADRMTNTKFFLKNGGLHLVEEIHTILLGQPWYKVCHIDLLYLEKSLLSILFIVCIIHHPRQPVVVNKHACLNNIVGSFLRVPVSSGHITVPDNPNLSTTTKQDQFLLLTAVIDSALGCLCNITEDETHQVLVVSNLKVMNQFVGCLQTPTFTHDVHVRVVCCLENLSYNPCTHQYLSTEEIIRAVINASEMPSPTPHFEDMDPALCSKLDNDLVKYFGAMTIAQLVLTKVVVFPPELHTQITAFLDGFLCNVDSNLLHKWAVKVNGYRWQDIYPVMRLVYSPLSHTSSDLADMVCLEVGILGLQIILGRDDERQVLIKQGLLDYLVCLPWFIPERHRAHRRSHSLLDMVGAHVPLQPPSLNNIVRAKLAVTSCGLKKAMYSDCRQLVCGL